MTSRSRSAALAAIALAGSMWSQVAGAAQDGYVFEYVAPPLVTKVEITGTEPTSYPPGWENSGIPLNKFTKITVREFGHEENEPPEVTVTTLLTAGEDGDVGEDGGDGGGIKVHALEIVIEGRFNCSGGAGGHGEGANGYSGSGGAGGDGGEGGVAWLNGCTVTTSAEFVLNGGNGNNGSSGRENDWIEEPGSSAGSGGRGGNGGGGGTLDIVGTSVAIDYPGSYTLWGGNGGNGGTGGTAEGRCETELLPALGGEPGWGGVGGDGGDAGSVRINVRGGSLSGAFSGSNHAGNGGDGGGGGGSTFNGFFGAKVGADGGDTGRGLTTNCERYGASTQTPVPGDAGPGGYNDPCLGVGSWADPGDDGDVLSNQCTIPLAEAIPGNLHYSCGQTPTPTPTPAPSATPTVSPSATPTVTSTPTPEVSPTPTVDPSATGGPSATAIPSPTEEVNPGAGDDCGTVPGPFVGDFTDCADTLSATLSSPSPVCHGRFPATGEVDVWYTISTPPGTNSGTVTIVGDRYQTFFLYDLCPTAGDLLTCGTSELVFSGDYPATYRLRVLTDQETACFSVTWSE